MWLFSRLINSPKPPAEMKMNSCSRLHLWRRGWEQVPGLAGAQGSLTPQLLLAGQKGHGFGLLLRQLHSHISPSASSFSHLIFLSRRGRGWWRGSQILERVWGSTEWRGGRQWIIVPFIPKHFHSQVTQSLPRYPTGLAGTSMPGFNPECLSCPLT